jgi:hypothetical protein
MLSKSELVTFGAGAREVEHYKPTDNYTETAVGPVAIVFVALAADSSPGVSQDSSSPRSDKLLIVKVRDLVRLIEADGWRHVRTTG